MEFRPLTALHNEISRVQKLYRSTHRHQKCNGSLFNMLKCWLYWFFHTSLFPQLLILAAVVAVARAGIIGAPAVYSHGAPLGYAAPAVAKVAAPVAVDTDYDPNPQYSYAYDIQDALTGDAKSQQESRSGDVVQGSPTAPVAQSSTPLTPSMGSSPSCTRSFLASRRSQLPLLMPPQQSLSSPWPKQQHP
jgi:hypothetical protein